MLLLARVVLAGATTVVEIFEGVSIFAFGASILTPGMEAGYGNASLARSEKLPGVQPQRSR
ncbi:MAG: hypothetical protein COB25_014425 [Oceanospirillales bacterium]|uniref:hypothetical protein n=1 Tax=Marinobacter maritimus TaxID=277961 RepID=UPI000BC97028|nr:hypothetical protein [Marinobacter maritimus]MBL1273640.1 hypothetical protein [Oceanospirillales bacterium]